MTDEIKETDGVGQLEVNGHLSDTPYRVTARLDDGRSYQVETSVSAPRDWLLKQGFKRDATLVSQSGRRIALHTDHKIDVEDAISVVLTSQPELCATGADIAAKYPELALS